MAIIIRTAFNNQNWMGKCKNADRARRLKQCRKNILETQFKIDKSGNCVSNACWESTLATKYYWKSRGNFSKQRTNGTFFCLPRS